MQQFSSNYSSLPTRFMPVIAVLLLALDGAPFDSYVAADILPKNLKVTDSTISDAIEERLIQDDHVPEHFIDVHVTEGIVTFTGEVDHILARDRVAALAETIRGVRSVINRLVVSPSSSISDRALGSEIAQALLEDPVTELYDLNLEVHDGIVTISGRVQSWVEKQLTLLVIKGVKGVREVHDAVKIDPTEHRSDQAMTAEIGRSLASDVWINAESIEVSVKDGIATLSGTVFTDAQKSRSTHLSWVYGITEVDNDELTIDASMANSMQRPGFPTLTNLEVRRAVTDSFLLDPRVDPQNVAVHSRDGLITLSGTVKNLRAKHAAEEDALNTAGVYQVKNRLKVRVAYDHSDDEIAKAVQSSFSRDPFIDPDGIHVTVRDGTVYLRGKVNSRFQKSRATTVIAKLKGVVEIVNQLEHPIKWLWKSDFELREDIKDRLWWSPMLSNQGIDIRVADGVATLSGTATSAKHKHDAEEAAYEAGARSVINQVRLKSLR